jgi:hypothetical protein
MANPAPTISTSMGYVRAENFSRARKRDRIRQFESLRHLGDPAFVDALEPARGGPERHNEVRPRFQKRARGCRVGTEWYHEC